MSNSLRPYDLPSCQAPLSMEFSRQEYKSGLPCPPPGDPPNPGTEPRSPALQADSLLLNHPGSPKPAHLAIFKCIVTDGLTQTEN